MRNYKTEGIIIKRTNFSEADRILTILTKTHGKIKVIAKGVRRITSKRGGNVELLNLAELTLHEGVNFDLLTEASVKESFISLKNDMQKIGWAYYVCELVDGLCAEKQENQRIFYLLTGILTKLNNSETDNFDNIIQQFESTIAKELGFWPDDKAFPEDSRFLFEQILEKELKSKNFLQKIS